MKIVIDVKESLNPQDKDLLIYNSKTQVWEAHKASYVFAEQNKKIKDLEFNFNVLKQDFGTITNILKEMANND